MRAGVEACDDGNQIDEDVCTNACSVARCGDGIRRQDLAEDVEGYEACDDGNQNEMDRCTSQCALAVCGDGHRAPWEGCDDGNREGGDGCGDDPHM